ncbi:MAG TPA: hypothetical protein VF834_07075 [Streptosporangiaceae bacterium]
MRAHRWFRHGCGAIDGEPVRAADGLPVRRIGRDRVDDHGEVRTSPGLDQPNRLAVAGHQPHRAGHRGTDLIEHGQADAIVTAELVAHADHDHQAHPRSTLRSRKCVAHEMHGS